MNHLPIVGLANILEKLAKLGVKKKKISSITPIESFDASTLEEKQKKQLQFAPKNEIVVLDGSQDLWFRSRGRNWAITFVLLPGDLVLLCAEFMAGAENIVIAPCAGVSEKGESIAECAKRETEEESGIVLESVTPLSLDGLSVSSRKSTEKVFPFIGLPKLDSAGKTMFKNTKYDEGEDLVPFLMPLRDYWKFLNDNRYDNSVAGRDCAYAALRFLGKLKFIS